ncbi:MAG: DNA-3-methyladenine glycosylase [Ignavibacteria bacterium]|jgi:DNA-3-methyladenine glycosylase II|nr:DNA-3-methyladenine glycosylase [Ignavibacteria bacterium]MDH7528521.1 DNA-3-methyladenine glycosylase [Ignavibacteria bacterium]
MKQYNESLKINSKDSFDQRIIKAVNHLKRNDKILAKVINEVGSCTLKPQTDPFESIIDAVISQQLSMYAAQSIFNRFVDFYKPKTFPTPDDILKTEDDDLRKIGISNAKIRCIKDLSEKIKSGKIHLNQIHNLSDEEIVKELTQVKGIGRWTAHMFLIFSLGRLNVLPTEDLGIRKGIMKLYRLRKLPDEKKIREIANKNNWFPYCSIASWYIWRSLELK